MKKLDNILYIELLLNVIVNVGLTKILTIESLINNTKNVIVLIVPLSYFRSVTVSTLTERVDYTLTCILQYIQ